MKLFISYAYMENNGIGLGCFEMTVNKDEIDTEVLTEINKEIENTLKKQNPVILNVINLPIK